MSFASSAFQNPENFVKLKISQTNTSGAPELVEEIADESAELDDTNGLLDDEITKLEEPYQKIQQEHLKVGIMVNKDINWMEPAVLKKILDVKITGMIQKPEGGDENHDMMLAVKNHNMTMEMENLEYREDVASMASSSSSTQQEERTPT